MTAYEERVKTVYEDLAERHLSDAEVREIALSLRQLAAFVLDCARDAELVEPLGVKLEWAATSADPHAIDNTTHNGQKPVPVNVAVKTAAPTAASRDLQNRESSAVPASLAAGTQPGVSGVPVQSIEA